MKKSEIKKVIENGAANLANGEYAISLPLTAIIYGGKISFDFEDGEETYEDENGEEVTKTGVIIEKDENGEVKVIVDNFEVYPPIYTVEKFAEIYGEDATKLEEISFDELKEAFKDFAEEKTPDFAAKVINEYYPDAKEEVKKDLIAKLIG